MQPVSADESFGKRVIEKLYFELAAKAVFRLGRCNIFQQGISGLCASKCDVMARKSNSTIEKNS